MPLCTNKR